MPPPPCGQTYRQSPGFGLRPRRRRRRRPRSSRPPPPPRGRGSRRRRRQRRTAWPSLYGPPPRAGKRVDRPLVLVCAHIVAGGAGHDRLARHRHRDAELVERGAVGGGQLGRLCTGHRPRAGKRIGRPLVLVGAHIVAGGAGHDRLARHRHRERRGSRPRRRRRRTTWPSLYGPPPQCGQTYRPSLGLRLRPRRRRRRRPRSSRPPPPPRSRAGRTRRRRRRTTWPSLYEPPPPCGQTCRPTPGSGWRPRRRRRRRPRSSRPPPPPSSRGSRRRRRRKRTAWPSGPSGHPRAQRHRPHPGPRRRAGRQRPQCRRRPRPRCREGPTRRHQRRPASAPARPRARPAPTTPPTNQPTPAHGQMNPAALASPTGSRAVAAVVSVQCVRSW